MNDELKSKVWEWFEHLTVHRIGVSALAICVAIGGYVGFENRQRLFDGVRSTGVLGATFKVTTPSKEQHEIISKFLVLHPEVAFISLLDADPVANRRTIVHRFYNDPVVEEFFKKADKERPGSGNGPLFTDNEANNAQVLAVANGEFMCSEVPGGILEKQFPKIATGIVKTCRVPLPPAFRKAGGWFAMHLRSAPDMASLKTDALTTSFLYFEADK